MKQIIRVSKMVRKHSKSPEGVHTGVTESPNGHTDLCVRTCVWTAKAVSPLCDSEHVCPNGHLSCSDTMQYKLKNGSFLAHFMVLLAPYSFSH